MRTAHLPAAAGLLFGVACAFSATASGAMDTAAIRAQVLNLRPQATIHSIRPAPFPGYSVVIADASSMYVSNDGRYILLGSVLDTKERKDLSAKYTAEARRLALRSISPEDKIVFSPKDPKHTVVVFTDITCGYCRMLHKHTQEYLDAGIRIEYVPWPRDGINSSTFHQMQSVWCSTNPQSAYEAAMEGTMPSAAPTCQAAQTMGAMYKLGQQMGIRGTPAIYDLDGHHLGGYLTPDAMLARLSGGKAP